MLSACCNGFVAYNEVLLGIFQDKVCQNRPISFQNRPIIKHLGRQTLSYVLPCCVFLLRYRWQVQLHSCCHTCYYPRWVEEAGQLPPSSPQRREVWWLIGCGVDRRGLIMATACCGLLTGCICALRAGFGGGGWKGVLRHR